MLSSSAINDVDGTNVYGYDSDSSNDRDNDRGNAMNDMTRNSTEDEQNLTNHLLTQPSNISNIPASTVTIDTIPADPISDQSLVSTSTNHQPSPSLLITKGSENIRLASLLERFVELSKMDGRFYLCDHQDMIVISNWLHSIPLTLAERFTFANAPVSLRDTLSVNVLYQFAATYALRRPVALNIRLSRHKPR